MRATLLPLLLVGPVTGECPQGSRRPSGYLVQGCSGRDVQVFEDEGRYLVDDVPVCVCHDGHAPFPSTACTVSNRLVVQKGRGKCLGPAGTWVARVGALEALQSGVGGPVPRSHAASLQVHLNAGGGTFLFGGWSVQGALGDLWRHTPLEGWTLLRAGAPAGTMDTASATLPVPRYGAALWEGRDRDEGRAAAAPNTLFMFGGTPFSVDSGPGFTAFNDVWRFTTKDGGEWTALQLLAGNGDRGFVDSSSGKVPLPGARRDFAMWQNHHGTVFLFGGMGFDTESDVGLLGDLWASSEPYTTWSFISGNKQREGTTVVNATSGVGPGGRCCAATATDPAGTSGYLFGGFGAAAPGSIRRRLLNELWVVTLATALTPEDPRGGRSHWTLLGGDLKDLQAPAVYRKDPLAVDSGEWGKWPSARRHAAAWFHDDKHLYIFAGQRDLSYSYDTRPCEGTDRVGDLWMFDTAGSTWTMIGPGDADVAAVSSGVSAGADSGAARTVVAPGPRDHVVAWTAPAPNASTRRELVVFAGCSAKGSSLGEMWAFQPYRPEPSRGKVQTNAGACRAQVSSPWAWIGIAAAIAVEVGKATIAGRLLQPP